MPVHELKVNKIRTATPRSAIVHCLEYTGIRCRDMLKRFIEVKKLDHSVTFDFSPIGELVLDTPTHDLTLEIGDWLVYDNNSLMAYSHSEFNEKYRKIGTF